MLRYTIFGLANSSLHQLDSFSRCLISPCKSLLDCNVFNFIYFD